MNNRNFFKYPIVTNVKDSINITNELKFNSSNLKIGVTTGCFDIFHSGHLNSIKFAYENCDYLILLLNSDESIKKLKGNTRPINKLEYRLGLLENLPFVDLIVIFDEKDADPILEKIYFNVFFKGGDYDINILKQKFPDVDIILSEHIKGNSTSLIIERIQKDL
jgi:D-beta-D-heptose 7-phosphate kinase/D-beta-D-heptose 1-phosphate adenosyltransferase